VPVNNVHKYCPLVTWSLQVDSRSARGNEGAEEEEEEGEEQEEEEMAEGWCQGWLAGGTV